MCFGVFASFLCSLSDFVPGIPVLYRVYQFLPNFTRVNQFVFVPVFISFCVLPVFSTVCQFPCIFTVLRDSFVSSLLYSETHLYLYCAK